MFKYFEKMFPFNISSRYIYRDYNWPKSVAGNHEIIPELFLSKTVYLVDFLYRQQSYVIRGSYDRLKPFLQSSYRYDGEKSKKWLNELNEQAESQSISSQPFQRPPGYPQNDRVRSNMIR